MRPLCCLLPITAAISLHAAQGLVSTLDGHKLEGEIEFGKDALVVKSASGESVTIAVDNIAWARFSTNAPASLKGAGNGLLGIYYATSNLTGAATMRLDDSVNFLWPQAPMVGLPHDGFSVRWMGYLEAPVTDEYTIHFESDDGGRIYLDDKLAADAWGQTGYGETNVTLSLKAGQKRKLKLEYFDASGGAQARLFWSTASMPKSVVPRDRLFAASFDPQHPAEFSTEQGLLATYYNSDDFTSNSLTRVDPEIDFDWKAGAPAPGMASNRFSVRWTGSVRVTNSGAYQFYVEAGLPLRFFINQRLVSVPWKVEFEQSAAALLRAGERGELRLELRATNTTVPVKLSWSGPGFAKTLLSRQHLSPGAGPVASTSSGSSAVLPAGVVLTGGVTLDAPVQSATESAIRFKGIFSAKPLPLAKVSQIIVKPLTAEVAAAIPKGRTGVLLKNRDFIDGEFAGIQDGQLKIGSVLFGARTFDLAKDVLAVVLRARESLPWRYSIAARDGSVLYGPSLSIGPARIAFTSATEYHVALSELLEVSRRTEEPAP